MNPEEEDTTARRPLGTAPEISAIYERSKRRLDRSHAAITELAGEVQKWRDANPFEISTTIAPDRLSWTMRATLRNPVDSDGWGDLFAAALHQMRTDLDNIVWGLIQLFDAEPKKLARVHFPVAHTQSAWTADVRDGIGGLPAQVLDVIRYFQPFAGLELDASLTPEMTPLAQLHSYDVMDKHRVAVQAENLTDWVSSVVEVEFDDEERARRNRDQPYRIDDWLETEGSLEISQTLTDPIESVRGTFHVPYRLVVLHDKGGAMPLVTGPHSLFRFTVEIVASLLAAGEAALDERRAQTT